MKISNQFYLESLLGSGSEIRIRDPGVRPDPDPDPNLSKYPDPTGSGSGSETLVKSYAI